LSELTVEQLIKLILGIFVVVAVAAGVFFFFKNQVIDFFKGLSVGGPTQMFLILIK